MPTSRRKQPAAAAEAMPPISEENPSSEPEKPDSGKAAQADRLEKKAEEKSPPPFPEQSSSGAGGGSAEGGEGGDPDSRKKESDRKRKIASVEAFSETEAELSEGESGDGDFEGVPERFIWINSRGDHRNLLAMPPQNLKQLLMNHNADLGKVEEKLKTTSSKAKKELKAASAMADEGKIDDEATEAWLGLR